MNFEKTIESSKAFDDTVRMQLSGKHRRKGSVSYTPTTSRPPWPRRASEEAH
jgi:hypothetical protein